MGRERDSVMKIRTDRFMVGYARSGHPAYGRDEQRLGLGGKTQYADPMSIRQAHRYLRKNLMPGMRPIRACVFELVPVALYQLQNGRAPKMLWNKKSPNAAANPVRRQTKKRPAKTT